MELMERNQQTRQDKQIESSKLCRGADLVHNVPAGVFEHAPDAAELERWAQSRWEVSSAARA